MGRKKMKNYLILFGLLFSIFIVPSDVLAAGEDLYIPYYNKVEDFDILNDEGKTLKDNLYSKVPIEEKKDNEKCFLAITKNSTYVYDLVCSNSDIVSSIDFFYNSFYNRFSFELENDLFTTYSFSSDFSYIKKFSFFPPGHFSSSNPGFENLILYSDFSFKFININSTYSNIVFYDISDSSHIYGSFDVNSVYNYKDFYLTDYNGSSDEEVVVFQDNDIHNISKLILGDTIPEEYSFVYTISDYLIVLIVVGVLISPIAIIIKVLRW